MGEQKGLPGLTTVSMPEGHLIHRLARLHRAWLRGRVFQVDSPQGRFIEGAKALDGARLTGVEARGKHLFYQFEGDLTLHLHLGLFGKIRTYQGTLGVRAATCRLRMRSPGVELQVIASTICELMSLERKAALLTRLGPDPLDANVDPIRFIHALSHRKTPLGVALMDQTVVSGVGNIFRAEALFWAGLSPWIPSHSLPPPTVNALWKTLTALLQAGERNGRIDTVPRSSAGERPVRGERMCVYRRDGMPCLRCAEPIQKQPLAARMAYWCPRCQPRC